MVNNCVKVKYYTSASKGFTCKMLKDKGQLSFEDKWPSMRPTILKLLRQETVTRSEWHDLFWLVHSVCLWDEKGPPKVYGALRDVS